MDSNEHLDPDFESNASSRSNSNTFEALTKEMREEYQKKYDELIGSQADAAQKVKKQLSLSLNDVTKELVQIAIHDPNARLRLDASKFILDRMVFHGKASDDELAQFFSQVTGAAEVQLDDNHGKPAQSPDQSNQPEPQVADDDTSED
jgi:hypothetical protein